MKILMLGFKKMYYLKFNSPSFKKQTTVFCIRGKNMKNKKAKIKNIAKVGLQSYDP